MNDGFKFRVAIPDRHKLYISIFGKWVILEMFTELWTCTLENIRWWLVESPLGYVIIFIGISGLCPKSRIFGGGGGRASSILTMSPKLTRTHSHIFGGGGFLDCPESHIFEVVVVVVGWGGADNTWTGCTLPPTWTECTLPPSTHPSPWTDGQTPENIAFACTT